MKLDKSSFTLLETLVSIFILSIIITGFANSEIYNNFDEEYLTLNKLENHFTTSFYTSEFLKKQSDLSLIINDNKQINIKVRKIEYKNNRIKLFKYEI